jgi:hypothetical protein
MVEEERRDADHNPCRGFLCCNEVDGNAPHFKGEPKAVILGDSAV